MKIFYRSTGYLHEATKTSLSRVFGEYESVDTPGLADLQLADYEDLDFQAALDDPQRWICAYSIRKALIRKHFLQQTVTQFVAKRPASILAQAIPQTWNLEVDYVEFLDDALDESFELRGELEANEALEVTDRKWYILKPGMGERGAGLRLFSTIDELTCIFEENEPESDDDSTPEDDTLVGEEPQYSSSAQVMTSDMRFFVIQEYMALPLLLSSLKRRKFHIRTYALCIGSLTVYVHRNMLVLSSSETFTAPTFDVDDLPKHLTNTCYQRANADQESQNVHAFWKLEDKALRHEEVWKQIVAITGELFEAASAQTINFQTIPNGFEIFGLDFLVDANHGVKLLEVNAYPDFAQTGESLHYLVNEVVSEMIELVGLCSAQARHAAPKISDVAGDYKGFTQCLSRQLLG